MLRIPPKAQASIEYMTIIALVVTGIVLMGPYVIRSINAYFHGLDDQVQDSFQEQITQSSQTNFDLPDCTCGDWIARGCGPTNSGGMCSTYQRYYDKVCILTGCENQFPVGPTKKCEPQTGNDITCCTDWADDICGRVGGTPCPGWQMRQTRTCAPGSTQPTMQCVDHPTCAYHCRTPIPANSTRCPGADTNVTVYNMPNTLVSGYACNSYSSPGTSAGSVPGGVYEIIARVWGGGGAGGGLGTASGPTNNAGGGGAGGGGDSAGPITIPASSSMTVTVGAGGTPGPAGNANNGGTSNFILNGSTLLTATGGRGVGQGSTTGGNDNATYGNPGGIDGANATSGKGGNGGNSGTANGIFGAGGAGGAANCNTAGCPVPVHGANGGAPGGGGGGGGRGRGGGAVPTGGTGANGRVDICYGNGVAACTGAKCEVYCAAPNVVNGDGSGCGVVKRFGFTVAAQINSSTNNQSFQECDFTHPTVTSIYVYGGSPCYNPGTPGTTCSAAIW